MSTALLFLSFMFFHQNCITKRGEVPADFFIRIEDIPSHPQPGAPPGAILEIRRKANSAEKLSFELMQNDGIKSRVIPLNYPDVLKLYDEIRDRKIIKMKERYSDMNVLDGGTTDLQLRMDGKEKRILLRNTTPPQLNNFFALIKAMQPSDK